MIFKEFVMKFIEYIESINEGRTKMPRPYQCKFFNANLKDLNQYSKDFQKKLKKLDRKLVTAKKWLYNRGPAKAGAMDMTFWNAFGNDLEDMIEELFGKHGEEPPEKYREDVYKFYQEHDYDVYKYETPNLGDFMC